MLKKNIGVLMAYSTLYCDSNLPIVTRGVILPISKTYSSRNLLSHISSYCYFKLEDKI